MGENNSIGEFIKVSRIQEGYKTQKQLSNVSGISQTTLSRIEAGSQKPRLDTLLQLSKYLHLVTYGELMENAGYLDGLSATDRAFMSKSFDGQDTLDENIEKIIYDLSKNDIFPIDVMKALISELTPLLSYKGSSMIYWNTPRGLKQYIGIYGYNLEKKYEIYKALLRVKNSLHIPQLLSKNYNKKIPLLRTIRAGLPILAKENWQEEIETPSSIKADFALRIDGDSMIYAGIYPRDIVLFKQANTANTGDVVAVGVEDSSWSANLKYFVKSNDHYYLRSANPAYQDIEYTDKHQIIGIMEGLIRESAPSVKEYKALINYDDTFKDEWLDVISVAQSVGLDAEKVQNLIKIQKSMYDQLSKK